VRIWRLKVVASRLLRCHIPGDITVNIYCCDNLCYELSFIAFKHKNSNPGCLQSGHFIPLRTGFIKTCVFLPRRQVLSQQQVPYTLVIFVYRHVVAVKICTINKDRVRNSTVQNITELVKEHSWNTQRHTVTGGCVCRKLEGSWWCAQECPNHVERSRIQ
jgi:hypothetical protein